MILIFGGTTEGRTAVSVIEQAGKPYYYSTRGSMQEIDCPHGARLQGVMDSSAIASFCNEHDIRLIVDAAHPFAENLHANISLAAKVLQIPVVRYERIYGQRDRFVVWCEDYQDAVDKIRQVGARRLLALTGVQTISKFSSLWNGEDSNSYQANTEVFFRILNREESLEKAKRTGFPVDHLLPYSEDNLENLIAEINPDAIITKESGESGGFDHKLKVAKRHGIPLYAVKRPPMPAEFVTVTGPHGLRREIERRVPEYFDLKSGFTTGSCATAAAKAALMALLYGEAPEHIDFQIHNGEIMTMTIHSCEVYDNRACASVIKVSGDDPDVTNGLEIVAEVSHSDVPGIHFYGGVGVGRVTLPGLGIEVGDCAINQSPRKMMIDCLSQLYDGGLDVTISVPKGKEVAAKTFNPRLGIVDGISIIGTSGIILPFSHAAFIESLQRCLEVALVSGAERAVLNSGAKSEKQVRLLYPNLPSQAFVHYGNAIAEALTLCEKLAIPNITVGIMIGKAVKLAEGAGDTHSKNVTMNREFLSAMAKDAGCTPEAVNTIMTVNLARQLWTELSENDSMLFFPALQSRCREMCRKWYHGQLELLLIRDK